MRTKLLLMSDSHYEKDAMKYAKQKYPDMDFYIHCGDCLLPPDSPRMKGYIAVCGNLDNSSLYPMETSLEIGTYRIWIVHGHQFLSGRNPDCHSIAREAKKRGYNVVFFGHTHTYYDHVIDGVRLLNPGSVWKTRDESEPCSLMTAEIDEDIFSVKKVDYVTLFLDV